MSQKSTTFPIALEPSSSEWHIRPVQLADVVALHETFWSDRSETRCLDKIRRVLQARSQRRGLGIVVRAPEDDTLLAYGQYLAWTRCAEISDLIVRETQRGQGIGTAMIQHLTHTALASGTRCIEIGAACSNPRALALYRRLGFEDKQTVTLDVGQGVEPIIYLGLEVPDPNL